MTASVNLADVSRFLVGSDTLKLTPFFIKTFNIPSIAFSHLELNNRSGTALHLGADTIDFNDLSLDIMLDSDFKTYFELLDLAFTEVDWETGNFAMPAFDLWVQVLNANGEVLFRIDFKNCRISSVGEVSLDPAAELGSTLNVGIVYDYWTYNRSLCEPQENGKMAPTCRKGPKRWVENAIKNVK